MKNCMFQYATYREVYKDTDLITLEEATSMFNDRKSLFAQHIASGERPEMAIWINCGDNSSYVETLHHWHCDDFIIMDSKLYKLEVVL